MVGPAPPTKLFDFVSTSDKQNADLTLKLMDGFGNILLKDIQN